MKSIEKWCIIETLRWGYRKARKKEKGEILTEVSKRIGVGRKQAMRLLGSRGAGRPKNPCHRGRPFKYLTYMPRQKRGEWPLAQKQRG